MLFSDVVDSNDADSNDADSNDGGIIKIVLKKPSDACLKTVVIVHRGRLNKIFSTDFLIESDDLKLLPRITKNFYSIK